jgi:hypothetical protein
MPPPVPKSQQKTLKEAIFTVVHNGVAVTIDPGSLTGTEQRAWRRCLKTHCLDRPEDTLEDVDGVDVALKVIEGDQARIARERALGARTDLTFVEREALYLDYLGR